MIEAFCLGACNGAFVGWRGGGGGLDVRGLGVRRTLGLGGGWRVLLPKSKTLNPIESRKATALATARFHSQLHKKML